MRLPVLESSSSVNISPHDPSMNSQRARPELWTVASQHTTTQDFFFETHTTTQQDIGKQNYACAMEAADLVVKRDAVTVRTSSDIAINGN
jgi:hypothetical protein